MFDKLFDREINAELIATFFFAIVSFLYLDWRFGTREILDSLFKWIFLASVMVFLTLVLVKIIENWHNRKSGEHKYVDWRRK